MKLELEDVKITGYEPVREIGEGFFSDVWLVRNRAAGYERAAKIITDERFIGLFKQEGRLTIDLQHPNIVRVYDVITDVERPYILMEYVDGKNLKQRLEQKKRFGEEEIKRIAEQIVGGMFYAHSQGVLHCDLKPANIMLGADKIVKISDFNLGLIVAEIGKEIASHSGYKPAEGSLPWQADFSGYPADQETVGFLRGTWMYMAPEVQRGGQPTKSSDQYSIGMILEEMLAHDVKN